MQILPILITLSLLLTWQVQARSLTATVKNYILGIRSAVLDQSPLQIEELNATFYFFHQENESVKLKMNVTKNDLNHTLLRDRHHVFISHGYMDSYPRDSSKRRWIDSMKEMIFRQLSEKVNVIILNWNKGASDVYPKSAVSTRSAGRALAEFILALREIYPIDVDKIHLIGHSLGAQVSGFAGKHLKSKHVQVGQITGLDPAGPLFSNRNCSLRLCSGDALLVTAIHTDSGSGGFGISARSGDIDVYLNGGKSQPGCKRSLSRITQYSPMKIVTCNHRRAHQFFIEYFPTNQKTCEPLAYQCNSYNEFINGDCTDCGEDNSKCRLVGFHPKQERFNVTFEKPFYLLTDSKAPFCMHVYEIKFIPSPKQVEGAQKIDLKLNDIRRTNFEREFLPNRNTSYLFGTSDFLGKIEQMEMMIDDLTSLDELVEKVEVNYLSHSNSQIRKLYSSRFCLKKLPGKSVIIDLEICE